jgi:monoamine oxidase
MASRSLTHLVVVGAGAAGLMAARDLARAGKRVTVLEARDRCGGRIYPLPADDFGYPAEGGPEFVHGAAPVSRTLMAEAGVKLLRRSGRRWDMRGGKLKPADPSMPHADRFYQALTEVTDDLPIADFLEARFGGAEYAELRRSVTRTVEGYDAADPHRFSTLALREEWMARDDGEHGRIAGGYGALIDYLAAESRRHGAEIHFDVAVTAIEATGGKIIAQCRDGFGYEADAAILAVPLPVLADIWLPPAARRCAAAAVDIGFGNVIKLLFRFATTWWADTSGRDLSDMSFLISDAPVPTWWTQHPAPYPVLTGWYAGPKADRVAALSEDELIEMGLASLAEIFGRPVDRIRGELVTARAINWGNDPFARGAYSYVTPETRAALAVLRAPNDDRIFFSGEAMYAGPDMGTVEAALTSGQEIAETILTASPV